MVSASSKDGNDDGDDFGIGGDMLSSKVGWTVGPFGQSLCVQVVMSISK